MGMRQRLRIVLGDNRGWSGHSAANQIPLCWNLDLNWTPLYTGRFIMYSRIKKIYDRKTVGHVFTKPVQIEGTTQKYFSQKVVFHRSSHFCC
jgi:hypothetical protein